MRINVLGCFSVRRSVTLVVLFLLVSCTPFRLMQNPPRLQLDSLYLMPSEGLAQRFKIGLLIKNVDNRPLRIQGMHFELALNGYDMLDGVQGGLTEVPAYGEARVEVVASANVLSTLRFINEWLQDANMAKLQYQLKAKLDVEGSPLGIPISLSGEVNLQRMR